MRVRKSNIRQGFYLVILEGQEQTKGNKAMLFQRELLAIGCRLSTEDGYMRIDVRDISRLRQAAWKVFGTTEIEGC